MACSGFSDLVGNFRDDFLRVQRRMSLRSDELCQKIHIGASVTLIYSRPTLLSPSACCVWRTVKILLLNEQGNFFPRNFLIILFNNKHSLHTKRKASFVVSSPIIESDRVEGAVVKSHSHSSRNSLARSVFRARIRIRSRHFPVPAIKIATRDFSTAVLTSVARTRKREINHEREHQTKWIFLLRIVSETSLDWFYIANWLPKWNFNEHRKGRQNRKPLSDSGGGAQSKIEQSRRGLMFAAVDF